MEERFVVPEDLKKLLRNYVSYGNGTVSETSGGNIWKVSDSDSEFSGYHDEENYYTCMAAVSDHEITLRPILDREKMRPDDEKRFSKLFQDYEIMDITQSYYSESDWPWKTIHRIHARIRSHDPETGSPMPPLWIVIEDTKTR